MYIVQENHIEKINIQETDRDTHTHNVMNSNNIYCIWGERKLLCTLYEVKWNDFQVQNIKNYFDLTVFDVVVFFLFLYVTYSWALGCRKNCIAQQSTNRSHITSSHAATTDCTGIGFHSCWYWTWYCTKVCCCPLPIAFWCFSFALFQFNRLFASI